MNLEEAAKKTESVMKAFNLNSTIKVKLKTKGYQRLADIYNSFANKIPNWEIRDSNYYERLADLNGYSTFQAWSFMQDFGSITGLGLEMYYYPIIIINDEDLTEVKLP